MFTVRTGDRLRPPVIRNESCECTMYNYIVHTRKFDNVGLEVHGSLRDFSQADQETVVGFSIAMTEAPARGSSTSVYRQYRAEREISQ